MTPATRRTDPYSSLAAAQQHAPRAASNHATILEYVRRCPHRTSAEIAVATEIERHEVSRRLADLANAGDVRQGAQRKCSTNGHLMTTWHIATPGATQTELW